ncbi:MAG: type IX secretion system sortase PorU [Bacteroidetes bacterium]|nr:type IX secretion system sortase PorU [Bacteroidota bacterium]
MSTRFLRITLAALSLLLAVSTATAQQITVLRSTSQELVVEYRPQFHPMDAGTHGVVYDFEGAVSLDISHAGAPDLRSRIELLGLPSQDGTGLEILQVDYRDVTGVRIAPVPGMRGGEEVRVSGEIYHVAGVLPASVASLENIGISRDRIVGELRFTPVQWDPSTNVARLYNRIVCRITYGPVHPQIEHGTSAAPAASQLNPMLLNAEIAAGWTLRREGAITRGGAITKAAGATLAEGNWYRFDVQQTGFYRLTRRWFADNGLDVSGIDPQTIRLFGNGGRERATRLSAERPDPLQEIAVEVVGGEDGRFDEGDYVQFFGQGLSGFVWNAGTRGYTHFIHRFDDANSYLLTWGTTPGKRMEQQASLNETGAYAPPFFTGREFEEEEIVNLMNSGKMWVAKRLVAGAGSAATMMYSRRLPGLVRSQPVTYRVQTVSSSEVANNFTVRANDATLGSIEMGTVDFGSDTGDMGKIGSRQFSGSGDLADDRSTVAITYNSVNAERSRDGHVDWVEWNYARRFEAAGDELLFSAPDTTAVIQFELNGFTMSDVAVYDVTDYKDVRRIAAQISGGTVRFQAENTEGAPRQFLAVAAPALKTPGPVASVTNSGLLISPGAEYLIITHSDLLSAAERLRAHRAQAGEDQLSAMVVNLEQIYNEFNSGVTDPTAIRDFLAWATANWSVPPRYVLFFGGGHFDYRNYSTTESVMVPVWETENSINRISSYVSDDYYAQVVGDDPRVDLATGRLPVQDIGEANTVVDKIIAYETAPELAPWKNRVTFVADDGWTGSSDTDRDQHTRQSERLAGTVPGDIQQRKVYIVSYRTENTAQGRRKPDANAAIIDQINEGTVIINYTGHGAHDVWAHERIFLSDVTVPQLRNADRLTFVAAATCTFGLYDTPGLRSGTELLILKQNGGAVGGLSAPRVVFSGENSAFNLEFFNYVLREGRESDGRARRLGDAIYSSKQRYNGIPGYEKFHLFADPGLRLALPRYKAALDRILVNDVPAASDTVQLRAFSKVTLEGSVRQDDGSPWDAFTGSVEVSLFDAERSLLVPEWNNYAYTMPGGLLYRGKANVDAGRFAVTFIVPKDISYENNPGRVAMYFTDGSVDGAGYFLDLTVGGSDSTASADTEGPGIALFLDGRDFVAGDLTGKDPLLLVDLFDVSGINTTGIGIGHVIEVWLDDGDRGIVLNDYYTGEIDSYQRGTVDFRFRNLAPGPHTLRLRAWDVYNNSATAETYFTVADQLTLLDVGNYPNPVDGQTTFRFRHNVLDPVDVEIRIHATNGALVRRIRADQVGDRIVEIPWDGRDANGGSLARGVYFYRVICRTTDGAQGSEALGRMTVLR